MEMREAASLKSLPTENAPSRGDSTNAPRVLPAPPMTDGAPNGVQGAKELLGIWPALVKRERVESRVEIAVEKVIALTDRARNEPRDL